MAPKTPGSFYDIQTGLNELQQGYKVFPDPNQPDRVLIVSPTGQELNISVRASVERGQTGKTWMVQSPSGRMARVITPELTATYETRTGNVSYEGTTSAQNLATIIDQAFVRSQKSGTAPGSAFQGLLSLGDPKAGISPAPSLPYSPGQSRPASERKILGSVGVNLRTDIPDRAPDPDQSYAIWSDIQQQVGRAGTAGFPTAQIGGRADLGGYPLSFERMSQAQMMLGDKATLIPHVATSRIPNVQATGYWNMPNDPKRYVKAPNLTSGVDAVQPYRMENGTVVPVQAGVTSDVSRPAYAFSNVLFTGEDQSRAYERRSMVFGLHPVPGSATAYTDPQGVRADFYGREKVVNVPMKGVSLYDLAEGRASINMRNISHSLGGGEPIAHLGELLREGEDPEKIKARFGPGIYHHSTTNFVIPKYIDATTGLPADYSKEMAEGKKSNIITTDALVKQLKERLGMPIVQRAGTGMGLELGGYLEAGSSIKGMDIKAAEYGIGSSQSIRVGRQDVPVSRYTSELKGTGFVYGFFGGLGPRQMRGIMRDFSKTFEGGEEFYKQFYSQYGERIRSGMPMGIDLDEVAGIYSGITGEEGLSGQSFGARVFENTIRAGAGDSAANIRNIRRYGAGFVPAGQELSLGVWHPEQMAWLRDQWSRAQLAQNPEITQDAIDASFNQTFKTRTQGIPEGAQKQGFREVMQVTGEGTHMFMNMLTPRRGEHFHGRSAGFEWLSGLSEKYPGFARELGAHIETMKPQGPTQQAALGMLQYGVFQGQRREEYSTGEPLQMPTNYTELSREKLMGIGAYLQGAGARTSSIEKLRGLSERFLNDVPEGNLLWNPETRTFIPNPKAVLGSTFSELGIEAAGVARPYVNMLSSLSGIVSPELEMSPQQMADAGMQASQGMYGFVTSMIGGRGEFFKRLLSRNLPSGLGGRSAFNPTLAPNERWVPPKLAQTVARGMGYRGGMIGRITSEILESGAQMVGARYPQLAQRALYASQALKKSDYIGRIGEERYRNIHSDPSSNWAMGAPGVWGQYSAGDFDFDPYFEVMGLRRGKGGALERIDDPTVASQQMTLEMANREESRYFANRQFSNLINAQVSQLQDYAAGKDVMGGILGGNKTYNAFEAFGMGVQNMMSKMFGMGVGYNPRRGALAAMSAFGYSGEETAGVLSTIPSLYQPALDKLLTGKEAAGVPIAATLAKSYFGTDEETGIPYLKLGSNDTIRRKKRVLPDGTVLPEIASGGVRLDVTGMEGLSRNRMAMLKGTSHLVNQFVKGADLSKGGNARMSASQMARWFARPGEHEMLAERLGNDPSAWEQEVGSYYQEILGESPDIKSGLEQVYKTPAWATVLANAASKAVNRTTDLPFLTEDEIAAGETGEYVPGALAASQQFVGAFSEEFQTGMEGAVALRDIGYRARGMNLRGMRSRAIQSAIQMFPEESIAGKGIRAIGRMLNIDFNRPEFEFRSAPEAGIADRELDAENRYAKYYRDAKAQGTFTGTFDEYVAQQEQADIEYSRRSASGQYSTRENREPWRSIDWSTARAIGQPAAGGSQPPSEPPTPPPPAAPPAEPPGGDDGSNRRGRNRVQRQAALNQRQQLPRDVEMQQRLAKRVGSKDMGIYVGRVRAYLENTEGLAGQLDPILEELGYPRPNMPANEEGRAALTSASVRSRLEQAFVDDPVRLKSALPPKLYEQMLGMQGAESDINYLMATLDSAPGLGARRQEIQQLTSNRRLRDDLFIGGWFAQAAGGRPGSARVKNRYMVRSANQLSMDASFQSLYSDLGEAGILGAGGQLGEEQIGQLRNLMAQHPEYRDILRRTGQMATESPQNLPSSISQVAGVAKAYTSLEGSGSLGQGKNYVTVDPAAWERLNAALEVQKKKQIEVAEATKGSNERLDGKLQREKTLADLEVRAAQSSFMKQGAQQELDLLMSKLKPGETPAPDTYTRISRLQKSIAGFERDEMAATEGIADIQGDEKWGKFARRALGGFGLMYMRSIGNFATSGWGYGMNEAQAMRQQFAAGGYAATGQSQIVSDQNMILQNQMALNGVSFDPRLGFQQFAAANSWARDAWTPLAAGIGAWGYSQFAGEQIGGTAGKRIQSASGLIGFGAAGLAIAGDIYARSQDPGLGARVGRAVGEGGGLASVFDILGYGIQRIWDKPAARDTERASDLAGGVRRAFDRDATMRDILDTAYMGREGQSLYMPSDLDVYTQVSTELQQRNLSWAPETAGQVAGFLMRTPGMKVTDARLQDIAADYQMGGFAAQTSQAILQAAGYSARGMYQGDFIRPGVYGNSPLSDAQLSLAGMNLSEADKAALASGLQFAGGLQGTKYIQGFGAKTGASFENQVRTLQGFGAIAGTGAGDVFASQQAAWYASQQAGLKFDQPNLSNFLTPEGGAVSYDPFATQTALSSATAQQQAAQQRIAMAQGLQANAYGLGNQALGNQIYSQMMSVAPGQEWLAKRIFSGDPLAMASLAAGGQNLGQFAGPTTIQGTTLDPNILAMTDMTDSGRLTGLNWGRTSLRLGSISSQQMGGRLFGGLDNAAVRAAVNGQSLFAPVTLPSGDVVSSVGGTLGLDQYGNQLNYNYQMSQIGLQREQMGMNTAYQQNLWGLQDQQRALSFRHTMRGFGFQQESMGLQQENMQRQNRQWQENFALNMQQNMMQRGWTREDWAFNAETRNMQWGWQQEDFQESVRFMTGRQRRLSERQMERQTITHNREEDQIDKQKERQEELWRIQDERFKLEKKSHEESYEAQKKQMELQRRQFEENKRYFLENKRIEDEIIKLQRQHWKEQQEVAKRQLDLSEEHAKRTLELQQATNQLAVAMELTRGQMNLLVEDSLQNFQQSVADINGGVQSLVNTVGNGGGSGQWYSGIGQGSTAGLTGANNAVTGGSSWTFNPNAVTGGGYGSWLEPITGDYLEPTTGYAQGGKMTASDKVLSTGEQGEEFVIGGVVVPAELTQRLKRLGVRAGGDLATGPEWPALGSNSTRLLSSGSQRRPIRNTIIVQVGNEEFKRFIVDTVEDEL